MLDISRVEIFTFDYHFNILYSMDDDDDDMIKLELYLVFSMKLDQ
jgi:hypothetical protein